MNLVSLNQGGNTKARTQTLDLRVSRHTSQENSLELAFFGRFHFRTPPQTPLFPIGLLRLQDGNERWDICEFDSCVAIAICFGLKGTGLQDSNE